MHEISLSVVERNKQVKVGAELWQQKKDRVVSYKQNSRTVFQMSEDSARQSVSLHLENKKVPQKPPPPSVWFLQLGQAETSTHRHANICRC